VSKPAVEQTLIELNVLVSNPVPGQTLSGIRTIPQSDPLAGDWIRTKPHERFRHGCRISRANQKSVRTMPDQPADSTHLACDYRQSTSEGLGEHVSERLTVWHQSEDVS
jgi:hypothetical protein